MPSAFANVSAISASSSSSSLSNAASRWSRRLNAAWIFSESMHREVATIPGSSDTFSNGPAARLRSEMPQEECSALAGWAVSVPPRTSV
eukprot:CAMPEP_0182541448 /NCGR_PEP_ID=MMETSP1323-20130603/28676_1 /TAXON_ID=236787 /ORGANISM="Florenciella parvula, Strain RCC1693" /LENGTH=88 /DNA_ID=CAMNT_0024752203 /DNA_START=124 /DNA_END=391 /DNA_ORIENTATION=+